MCEHGRTDLSPSLHSLAFFVLQPARLAGARAGVGNIAHKQTAAAAPEARIRVRTSLPAADGHDCLQRLLLPWIHVRHIHRRRRPHRRCPGTHVLPASQSRGRHPSAGRAALRLRWLVVLPRVAAPAPGAVLMLLLLVGEAVGWLACHERRKGVRRAVLALARSIHPGVALCMLLLLLLWPAAVGVVIAACIDPPEGGRGREGGVARWACSSVGRGVKGVPCATQASLACGGQCLAPHAA